MATLEEETALPITMLDLDIDTEALEYFCNAHLASIRTEWNGTMYTFTGVEIENARARYKDVSGF